MPAANDIALSEPPSVDDAELRRREDILAKLPMVYQTRYRELLELHDHPNPEVPGKSLTVKQHQELIDVGLVRKATDLLEAAEEPVSKTELLYGLEAVANHLREKHNYSCVRNSVSRWMKGTQLPSGVTEWFPAYHESNRHLITDVDGWAERNLPKINASGGGHKMDDRARKAAAEARMAERADAREERQFSEEWILKADAKATVIAALNLHHSFAKRQCEKQFKAGVLDKLAAGFTEQQLTQISEACIATGREVVSAIEMEAESI